MMEDYRGKPRSGGGKVAAFGAVAVIHAVLFFSGRERNTPGFMASPEGERIFYLVSPRATPLPSKGAGPAKPLPGLPKKSRAATAPLTRHDPTRGIEAESEASVIEATVEVDENWAASQAGKSASVANIHDYSVSLAGKVDAESRLGKPAPLEFVDTPFKRMQNQMAQAARGGGNSTTTIVSASGEPITVITRNGKTRCYVKVSTSVAPSAVFNNRGSERATEVNCPRS